MDRTVTAQSPPSDNDSGERPVRQQLKQTNLDAVGENKISTRPNRKRSLDNTDGATDSPPIKRSRECTPDTTAVPAARNSEHAAVPKDTTTQDVSTDVLATAPVSTSVHNTRPSHNPIMSHIPETKVQFPLDLEIKVSIGGFEQVSHVTVPVEIGIKVTAGAVSLASSTSKSTEGESSKIHVTIPSAKPTPPSGTPSSGTPPPGIPPPGTLSSGAPPSGARSAGAPSPVTPTQPLPDYLDPDQPLPEALKDESFHIFEKPESIGDSSSEDSLSDYRSSPPVPYSSSNPDHPRPSVEAPKSTRKSPSEDSLPDYCSPSPPVSYNPDYPRPSVEAPDPEVLRSNHARFLQSLGMTVGNEDDSSQPEKKRPRDNSEERKAKVDQTFTASAFGKASSNPSPFAMPNKSTSDASPFATKSSTPSGFSGLGSGFSAFGSSFPRPLCFASPNAPVSLAESSNKTLGAEQDDEEDEDGPVGEPDDTFVAEKTDERFHTQTGMDPALLHSPWTPNMARDSYRSENSVETGEENETTEFTAKGKLYGFDDKKWKERGAGTFKVNLKTESDGKKSGRIIMRADGALRVMLNSAIWQTMPFGDIKGSRPTTRDIYLASKEDEKVVSLLLRLGNEKPAQELYDVLKDILDKI
ncbi:hypothetical protein N7524_010307 [Penicillium chrysogenum]|nr:hypothetical protein N7524_010307 [Penicillium chrysogenum]